MGDPEKGRIAIRFGTPSSSNRPSPRPNPPSSLGKRPRHHALGAGSDSESDDEQRHRGLHEVITGFGADGAETERERRAKEATKKEFVIERQPNRDWRSEAKAQRPGKNLLPEEARAQRNGTTVETEPADQDKGMKWGLMVKERPAKDDDQPASGAPDENPEQPKGHAQPEPPAPQRTADDEAMDALLGRTSKKQKTIPQPALSEGDAYRRDAEAAGAASTLEDYEAMPVEEFGAALLRGMGWNGEQRGPKPKEARRRANRLGLGAKELKEAEDLGGWNQNGGKKKRPRLDEYRREESKRKEGRRHEDSYKKERDRERDTYRDRDRDRDRHRDVDRHRERHRDYDRDRRR
ncbi:Pre-mRNA-splicing factor SPP2 [Tolypocladium ophioglossoides CBS 100239]|uniref:Pre-mRNA-splicing factor n=1 Tax=Tolypocladium ophioglossoides (strain CBS 100239) TaxID=1163406 RepID=A0A0L0NEG9_TOLOC|nr:Pre-mRNA-splicing factor SPP2 [Tolypocladium ophioglossoides CBS 100239]